MYEASRSFYNGTHTLDCWQRHPECALSSAVSYLTARVAHDTARLRLYRQAGVPDVGVDQRDEAVQLARQLMSEISTRDWSRAG